MPQVLAQERGDDPGRQALSSHGALPNIWPESTVVLGRVGAGENSRRMQDLCYRKWKSVCKNGSNKDSDRQKGGKKPASGAVEGSGPRSEPPFSVQRARTNHLTTDSLLLQLTLVTGESATMDWAPAGPKALYL